MLENWLIHWVLKFSKLILFIICLINLWPIEKKSRQRNEMNLEALLSSRAKWRYNVIILNLTHFNQWRNIFVYLRGSGAVCCVLMCMFFSGSKGNDMYVFVVFISLFVFFPHFFLFEWIYKNIEQCCFPFDSFFLLLFFFVVFSLTSHTITKHLPASVLAT